jgi:hypothetical protein
MRIIICGVLAGVVFAGCGNDQSDSPTSSAVLSKAAVGLPIFPGASHFVAEVTNPYLNFARGRTFRYESQTDEGLEVTVDEVTNLKKTVMGIDVTVVHDQVLLNDKLIEDTFDWYAQDDEGNVWYFGEDTKTLDGNGNVITTQGSWEAGISGSPGLVMLAAPFKGAAYQQEDAPDIAEDQARVKSLDAFAEVPYGSFDECVQTTEWTPLEPGVREYKFYKAGVGLVLETGKQGERVELVDIDD